VVNVSRIEKARKISRAKGPIVRSAAFRNAKFCSKDVAELVQLGYLKKIRRGYYAWRETLDSMSELEIISKLIPQGVVTLFSAAHYHDMTTVNPMSIEIAMPTDMRTPVLPDYPPVTVYKWVRHIYEVGVENIRLENCVIKLYDRERTVCDFFRMRLQIGKDVSIEVLKNYMLGTKNIQKLYEYADMLQIKTVIRPYVEALL
jgi:predicted transcriptional regulator of viral defense system